MKYLSFLIALLIISNFSNAQNFSKKFGEISKDEIELTSYYLDESAEAVVLYDIGKSYFVRKNNSFDVVFERTTRIKILSDAGLEYAEVEIPLFQEDDIYEKAYDIEAYTYNYDKGQLNKTKLNTSNCVTEKKNEYWVVQKFAMPDIQKGSIIEYRYKINSQYKFNLRDWAFQRKIPTVYSEYNVSMIPFYEYKWFLQGANKFDIQTSHKDHTPRRFGVTEFHDIVYTYAMQDVPAFKREELITSMNDYIIKIYFQLGKVWDINGTSIDIITTWPKFIDQLLKRNDFGKYIKKSEKEGSKLLNLKNVMFTSQLECFDSILNYVKKNYSWNNVKSKFASKSPDDFVKDKFGNSADINLFVVGLFDAAGIKAFPVLISTRKNGKIKYDYPFHQFFDFVIISATIDGKHVLSDATEILNSNNRIPPDCLNDKGLLVEKNKVEWINLQSNLPSEIHTDILINADNLSMTADFTISATEYDALYYRKTFGANEKKVEESLTEDGYNVTDSSIIVQNGINIKEPYIVNYSIKNKTDMVGNKIYISPFLNEIITDNPLTQKVRTYPIDMIYPEKRVYNSTIIIPGGYKIDFLPQEYKIKNDLFELNYIVISSEKEIKISFNYYFKNSIYSAKDYSKVKFYFMEIVKKGNEKVVLLKN